MIKTLADEGNFHFDLFNSMSTLELFLGMKEEPCTPCKLSEILKQDISDNKHNCLGCSFNKVFNNAYRTLYEHFILSTSPTHGYKIDREFVLYNCFHWLNLAVEQVKFIKKVIKLNGGDSSMLDTDKYFDGFRIVNKITNLFKHPKAFAFTHHLEYVFEYENPNFGKYQKVNFSEIYDYFCKEERVEIKQKEFLEKYSNKIIAIELPPLRKLIGEFLMDFIKFLEAIRNNEEYIRILSNHSNL